MKVSKYIMILTIAALAISCSEDSGIIDIMEETTECIDVDELNSTRPGCTETLQWENEVAIDEQGSSRKISTNSIPGHITGLFGGGQGSLNPNTISEQQETYSVSLNPEISGVKTVLLSTERGPQYSFGVLLNGVQLDPEAAEPWPHTRPVNFNSANWEWNLDAMAINLGLDCNNAHVQPTGKYHYHGAPTLFLESLNASDDKMTLIGYAADGFPLYYKYGMNSTGSVEELKSSYQLKTGDRPGDGNTAPCGEYSGIYTADYEFVDGLGDLDECNGTEGVTPEYPNGSYYYVITNDYPFVGRCLVGTPSNDFKMGM